MEGCGGMWQGVGACGRGGGRVWRHVTGDGGMWYGVRPIAWTGTCGKGGPCGMVWGHVAGCGVMWQGVGSCGRGWRHVTRDRSILQGVGWGHVAGFGGMWQVVVVCGRVWCHVAGGGGMSQGLGAYGRGICQMSKSQRCSLLIRFIKILTCHNEVHTP